MDRKEIWVGIHGKVYDVTTYLDFHPGGRSVLEKCKGTESTVKFSKWPGDKSHGSAISSVGQC